jgi:hypothetical protein
LVTSALLATSVSAQQASPSAEPTKSKVLTQITIEGKQISGDDVLVQKGRAYVSLSALAQALGAWVASQGPVAVLSIPAAPESECGTKQLSDEYRKAAVRIPDEIESLRVQANKQTVVIPAASFDEVDRQIFEADYHARNQADRSVSYALSHANATLAIMYYKLRRGIYPEFARQGELDTELCIFDSKFALEVGRLSGKEHCSVFLSKPEKAEVKTPTGN